MAPTDVRPGTYIDHFGNIHVVDGVTSELPELVIHRCGNKTHATPVGSFVGAVSVYDPNTGAVHKLKKFREIKTDATYYEVVDERAEEATK